VGIINLPPSRGALLGISEHETSNRSGDIVCSRNQHGIETVDVFARDRARDVADQSLDCRVAEAEITRD
jgi:hypothetical protein